MTTKPKAKKFRIRRSGSLGGSSSQPEEAKDAVADEIPDPHEVSTEQEIAAIRKEGLTGRQLRMARRLAHKHGLAATSDFDAIRLLRAKGVDPFHHSNMLELIVPKGQKQEQQPSQTAPATPINLPSTEVDTAAVRANEIFKIQRDIAKRRRRKLAMLLTRLAFFVLLPTLLAGYYYFAIATPMYATKSQFVIQKSDTQSASGIGNIFGGTGFATSQDSIAVQSFLQSRDAMLRLDQDHGFKAHFSQSWIDSIQRLDSNATNEAAYRLYSRRVKISYDPTEGIIKMEVVAADPQVSATYSNALISYAEQQVDQMTSRLRHDQMQGATQSYEDAEQQLLAAQERVIELQEKTNVISGDVEIGLLTSKISTLELELVKDELALEELRSNARPNSAKMDPLLRRITSLQTKIAGFRAQLTAGSADGVSIARVTSELAVAQANLGTRNLMLQAALQQLETARIEANRKTRYLATGVSPTPPDEATYPRKFENTMLAFLIFAGVYLMLSLTASILREQISS